MRSLPSNTNPKYPPSAQWLKRSLISFAIAGGLLCVTVMGISPSIVAAAESITLSNQELRSIQADRNRRNSVERARSGLGYPTFFYDADEVQRTQDHPGISEQLRRMPVSPVQPPAMVPPYGLPHPGWSGVNQLYGPKGPSIASVSHVMEQRLSAGHFYPLRLGGVDDQGLAIVVRLVNQKGAVEQVIRVNKNTGLWTTSR